MTSLLQPVDQENVALRTAVWLKSLRRTLGVSQRDMANAVGVHRNTYRNWEGGRTVPLLFQVERINQYARLKKKMKAGAR